MAKRILPHMIAHEALSRARYAAAKAAEAPTPDAREIWLAIAREWEQEAAQSSADPAADFVPDEG